MGLIHIGLVFDYSLQYCRGVLRGVKRYAQTRPDWVFLSAVAEAQRRAADMAQAAIRSVQPSSPGIPL